MSEENPIEQSVMNKLNPQTALARNLDRVAEWEKDRDYPINEPAVQKIPGVSYQDGDRNNAPVSLHLDSLEQRISMLYGKISGLKMALDPILAPMPPGDPRTESPSFVASPIVQRIKEMDDEVVSIIEYVERISAHVEV